MDEESAFQRLVWLDTETTGLHAARRPWDVALIVRDDTDTHDQELQWIVHPYDLDLGNADPRALEIGGFWERYPYAQHLRTFGDLRTPAYRLPALPPGKEVRRLEDILRDVQYATRDRATILGSNPNFDMSTLEAMMLEFNLAPRWHYHGEDVPTLIKGWLMGNGGPLPVDQHKRSDALCRMIGVEPDDYPRHTAIGDCRMFRDAYDALLRGYAVTRQTRRSLDRLV